LIHLETAAGEDIFTFAPTKYIRSIAFSSPRLARNTTYNLYVGGTSTGTPKDGLYEGGTYTPGTRYATFTIYSTVTNVR
jgi:hypothetical protein